MPAWAGAFGTFAAVSTALGIAIRDGRLARADRDEQDAKQARNVLAQPTTKDGFAFEVTNYSDSPVRNIYLENVRVAWKAETRTAGLPVYREIKWRMDPRASLPIPARPLLRSGETCVFAVGMPLRQADEAIAAYEVTLSLTDIETRRWRNVNGSVTRIQLGG